MYWGPVLYISNIQLWDTQHTLSFPLPAGWRREPGEGGGAGWRETRWLIRSVRSMIIIQSALPVCDLENTNLIICSLSAAEFDFQPRGHVELGEELGLIRQRWGPLSYLPLYITLSPVHYSFWHLGSYYFYKTEGKRTLVSSVESACKWEQRK